MSAAMSHVSCHVTCRLPCYILGMSFVVANCVSVARLKSNFVKKVWAEFRVEVDGKQYLAALDFMERNPEYFVMLNNFSLISSSLRTNVLTHISDWKLSNV